MNKRKKLAVQPPKLPLDELLENIGAVEFNDGRQYSNTALSHSDLSNRSHRFLSIDCMKLDRVALNGTVLSDCQFTDMVIQGVDLSNAQWLSLKINRAIFRDCKLTGFAIHDSRLANILFEGCVGELIQITASELKSCEFRNCQLPKADLRTCDLQGVRFRDCDLTGVLLYDAKLDNTDFRGSQLSGLKAFPVDLKGAIIDQEQSYELAPQLAKIIGLQIKSGNEE